LQSQNTSTAHPSKQQKNLVQEMCSLFGFWLSELKILFAACKNDCVYLTEFWKITHMGMREIIRISRAEKIFQEFHVI